MCSCPDKCHQLLVQAAVDRPQLVLDCGEVVRAFAYIIKLVQRVRNYQLRLIEVNWHASTSWVVIQVILVLIIHQFLQKCHQLTLWTCSWVAWPSTYSIVCAHLLCVGVETTSTNVSINDFFLSFGFILVNITGSTVQNIHQLTFIYDLTVHGNSFFKRLEYETIFP